VAVTGTSGKTSVATFVREIWTSMGFRAASLGTVGVVSPSGTVELEHTTPDSMKLQEIAPSFVQRPTSSTSPSRHRAMASTSTGSTASGSPLRASPTSLTIIWIIIRAEEHYFNAKMRLFEELAPAGHAAVINVDTPSGPGGGSRAAGARARALVCGEVG
jgi:UDP-N-acetylmuramoyl-L-alanyl-D-glutamate--2,6-diaminopimelate ligase